LAAGDDKPSERAGPQSSLNDMRVLGLVCVLFGMIGCVVPKGRTKAGYATETAAAIGASVAGSAASKNNNVWQQMPPPPPEQR
jgi:hypothetical protein